MSTQLIPVFQDNLNGTTVNLVDARLLHKFLESAQDFSVWIKARIKEYGFVENVDYLLHKIMERANSRAVGGHNKIDYHLTLDMAKELGMIERNDKGRQIRRYFLDMERQAQAVPKLESIPEPKTKLAYTGCLTLEQQDTIKQIVKDRIETLPKDQQGPAAMKLWGSIKSKYSVSYKFVPAEHYPAVISLIARLPLNTDLPPPPTSTAPDTTVLLELRNGQIINSKTLAPGCQIYDPRDPTSAKNMILNHTPAQQLTGLIDIMLKRVQAIAHSH